MEYPALFTFGLYFDASLLPFPGNSAGRKGDGELQGIYIQIRGDERFETVNFLHGAALGRKILYGRSKYGEANNDVLYARMAGKTMMRLGDAVGVDFRSILLNTGVTSDSVDIKPSSYDIGSLVSGKTAAFCAYLTGGPFYREQRGADFTATDLNSYGTCLYNDTRFASKQELTEQGRMNTSSCKLVTDSFVKSAMTGKGYSLQAFISNYDLVQEIEQLWKVIFTISAIAGLFFIITLILVVLQRRLKREIQRGKKVELEIRNAAFYDPLTRLPNRRLLFERLQQALAQSARRKTYGAILFLDLDNFKMLNDTRGHHIGDLLLAEVAQRLQGCVRENDTVARLGGDEFVVMVENLSKDSQCAATQARKVGMKILSALNRPFILRGQEFQSSSSIGVSLFIDHRETPDDLLKRSDTAMYQAKSAGRNMLRFFDPAMQKSLEERFRFETEMRHALMNGEYRLCYQIQLDARRCPVGVEALLRWEHPQRGELLPYQFMPLAEETGLSESIGLWVLETACAQLQEWQSQPLTRDLSLAVNVCARQFNHPEFVARIQDVLDAFGVKPGGLKIELTERIVQNNMLLAIEKMRPLKSAGVKFSLDDFGIGYSSLSVLKKLPLDQLKIDLSLVRDLTVDARAAAIVRAIIDMSKTLGFEVIAEGVETEEQFDFLIQNGCLAFQGYLFGNLQSAIELKSLLRAAGAPLKQSNRAAGVADFTITT